MRVLITSVPAGSGHVKAAEALQDAFHRQAPGIVTEHLKVTDLVSPSFRKLYVDGYSLTVNRAPSLWGHLYHFWDRQTPEGMLTPLLHQMQRALSAGFYAHLNHFQPDLILTTHFLIPQLMAADPRPAALKPRIETVITDYDVHRFWISDAVSHYYVAHEDLISPLFRAGVSRWDVTAAGMPVHPVFSDSVSPSSIFLQYHLDPQRPVLMVLAGGLGLNALEQTVAKLLHLEGNPQIITVSGKNSALRERLDRLIAPRRIRLLNLGYVDNMHELLTISSLVITKPGGLTVSECLVKQKPMILFGAIPGQEEHNAAFLLRHGAAFEAKTIAEVPILTARLLNDRYARQDMVARIADCARPHAAAAIVENVLRSVPLAA